MDAAAVQWTEPPILPWLDPPPPERIIVRGARLVRIYNDEHADPRRSHGFREAVILAWARRGDGRWGALMAWAGWCRSERGTGTEAARCGWVLVDEQRVRPVAPARSHLPGIEYTWYGREEPCELGHAIRAAAQMLPEQLRTAALTPAPHQGP
jgi:hypothetical protein